MNLWLFSIFLLPSTFLLLPSPLAAQDFRSSTTTVFLPVTVTNSAGRVVSGVTAADFEIRDDGRLRPVAQFSSERVPVSLAVLLDVSGSMAEDPKARAEQDARWTDTRRALELLVSRLAPEDELLLAFFSDKVTLASAWTQNHQQAMRALAAVRPGGTTAMFEAVRVIAPAFQLARHPRHVLLVITDGNDSRTPIVRAPVARYPVPRDQQVAMDIYYKHQGIRTAAITETRAALNRTDASVYAIGVGTRKGGEVNHQNLEVITADTGGYIEALNDPADISAAVTRVCDELQSQYTLGFEPANSGGGYRPITVTVKQRGVRVRARAGYRVR